MYPVTWVMAKTNTRSKKKLEGRDPVTLGGHLQDGLVVVVVGGVAGHGREVT